MCFSLAVVTKIAAWVPKGLENPMLTGWLVHG